MKVPGLKIIDWYIIKKFLGTYLFTILLMIAIVIMFDYIQKVDSFIKKSAPMEAIIFDYYMNFIPYFINLLSPLFVFISVIFFTAQLADNSEIIAMLASGLNFKRLMRPYMISATIIAACTFMLNSYIIPPSNIKMNEFKDQYVRNKKTVFESNIQLDVEPGTIAYLDFFDGPNNTGTGFSLDRFEGKELKSRLVASRIHWDSAYNWRVQNYTIRDFVGMKEKVTTGMSLDTTLAIIPSDFMISDTDAEQMTTQALKKYIDRQKKRGMENTQNFEIEYHNRFAMTFAAYILTIIGASLSSRKIKGGMGMNIGVGLALSFSYILFMKISSTFAISGITSAFLAAWIPNIVFAFIAAFLYVKAPR